MVCDGSLGLDGAKQQHCHIGVHEEDQHEQGAHVVEGWQGNDKSCQQRFQTLQARHSTLSGLHEQIVGKCMLNCLPGADAVCAPDMRVSAIQGNYCCL